LPDIASLVQQAYDDFATIRDDPHLESDAGTAALSAYNAGVRLLSEGDQHQSQAMMFIMMAYEAGLPVARQVVELVHPEAIGKFRIVMLRELCKVIQRNVETTGSQPATSVEEEEQEEEELPGPSITTSGVVLAEPSDNDFAFRHVLETSADAHAAPVNAMISDALLRTKAADGTEVAIICVLQFSRGDSWFVECLECPELKRFNLVKHYTGAKLFVPSETYAAVTEGLHGNGVQMFCSTVIVLQEWEDELLEVIERHARSQPRSAKGSFKLRTATAIEFQMSGGTQEGHTQQEDRHTDPNDFEILVRKTFIHVQLPSSLVGSELGHAPRTA